MGDRRKRAQALAAGAVTLVVVVVLLMVLLTLFSGLNLTPRILVAAVAGLFSAAVVYALAARSDPPLPDVHADQTES